VWHQGHIGDCVFRVSNGDMPDLRTAIAKIRKRLTQKRAEYDDFRGHMAFRMREEDAHGCWDAAVNMSEVSNFIDGLEFALRALGETP
jgi:hypothetical protein